MKRLTDFDDIKVNDWIEVYCKDFKNLPSTLGKIIVINNYTNHSKHLYYNSSIVISCFNINFSYALTISHLVNNEIYYRILTDSDYIVV